jgi:outer membrane lipoprotein SlyB
MGRQSLLALTLSSVLFIGACATGGLTGETYTREDARKVQQVEFGNVVSVRSVVIEGNREGIIGNIGGGVIGGIAGSTIGDGSGRALATVIGAIAGGVAGQAAQEKATRKQGQEISIRIDSGRTVSVVQEVIESRYFQAGERVRLLEVNGTTRVSY